MGKISAGTSCGFETIGAVIRYKSMEKIIHSLRERPSAGLLESMVSDMDRAARWITQSIRAGGKIFSCGNGGSFEQAQHFAGELVGRFQKERRALPAIALGSNQAALSAIANDYGYEFVFARELEGMGKQNDVLFALSTSGNSKNIIEAVRRAQKMNIKTVGLLGRDGGALKPLLDLPLVVPLQNAAHIQEMHLVIIHVLCEIAEDRVFS